MAVYKTKNSIQPYAWGSSTAIPELLGYENPGNEPMAELWMGAHPKAPSVILKDDNTQQQLNDYISAASDRVLGKRISEQFGRRLPFLFKVLAAGSPLSIQSHPNLKQAADGFRRENEAGIPLDAFNRNYKDDNHKPEIICALTEYSAMRGFRPAGEIASAFRKIMIPELEASVSALETVAAAPAVSGAASVDSAAASAVRIFFSELMSLKDEARERLLSLAMKAAEAGLLPESKWILDFAGLYPGDTGIVSPLYLNVVVLQPGEAMYLPAGELHAYLHGLGMELMANSDNVLRGGLTPKYIDVQELISTLTFSTGRPEILHPVKLNEYESAYITEAPEFILTRIDLDGLYEIPGQIYGPEMPSVFICLKGKAEIKDGAGRSITLSRGETAFSEHGTSLSLNGNGLFYRASVPAKETE